MFHLKYLYCFILLHSIIAIPQLNLHYTDWVSQSQSDNVLQHNCLRVVLYIRQPTSVNEVMLYCMSELPSKFMMKNDDFPYKFTFAELSKQNITSEHLYRWSTPIDIIEHYQFYLNQLSTLNNSGLAKQIFYNCTLPRFGPMCQYELPYHHSRHSSLNEIIYDFYRAYGHYPTNLTCYTHLKCNRGLYPSCLDWNEICNGQIDCLDDGIDEEHCWQLEINECKDNEYRCRNGQCIPQSFDREIFTIPDCVDGSDVRKSKSSGRQACHSLSEPSFECEEIACIPRSLANNQLVLTSSCDMKRGEVLRETMYSNNNNPVSEDCWSAFKCLIKFLHPSSSTCNEFCENNDCNKIVMNNCPNVLFFPNTSILFGNVYFVYHKNDLQNWTSSSTIPLYICYNTSHYDAFFINITKIFFNNITCVNSESFLSPTIFEITTAKDLHMNIINNLYELLVRYHLTFTYTSAICNRPNMYQCLYSSKCISIYRLLDDIYDCPYMDDENITGINHNTNITEQLKKTYFKCEISNKYIHQSLVKDGDCNCDKNEPEWCEDEDLDVKYIKNNISFQNICDELIDLSPIPIAERNETDETECEQWKCNNIYTRCNRKWNCPNGVDESGCTSHPTLNCSSKHHLCISPDRNQFICLPIEKANDGNIDCLGATDEPALCGTKDRKESHRPFDDFHCMNRSIPSCISSTYLCDGFEQCEHGDDEQFCTTKQAINQGISICTQSDYVPSDVEYFLCYRRLLPKYYEIIYFTLDGLIEPVENAMFSSSSVSKVSNQYRPRCHRGLDIRIWSNNITKYTCLCPSSYYGDQCQYQNQRISLSIGFQALSDSWRTLFAIVISLIDDSDQRIIHSYEQFTYLSVRHCPHKFNTYLLYSTRPKDPRKNYAIHIDIYEKALLTYRGSVLLPITFPFLPVHRLAVIVDIPRSDDDNVHSCSNDECIHGQCIKYYNNPRNLTFCQCNEGWSGRYCTIQHTCICAFGSKCIGVSANNRSICVCPLNKFGPRCLLNHTICHINNNFTCRHGGQCIPIDDYMVSDEDFACICLKGYSGDRCEIVDNKLILSFHEDLLLSQSIFTHFMEVPPLTSNKESPVRATTFQTTPLKQDSITIYWSRPFHIVFMELSNKIYYLIVVQKIYKQSKIINKMINPSDRCPNITELFNQTFLQWPLIRRIKYYHLPCQNQSFNLSCFHDEVHLCLCYDFHEQRLANCFKFDHNMTFNCMGQSECKNDAQCLQDSPDCPTKSICICPSCFYGRRCQFSTSGFGLSLDAILGYHILQDVSLTQQPFIIKISLALTIIFIIIGLINGILCLITFKNKVVCEVGCGLYLFGSSITTLLTMTIFGLKFLILVLAQMTIISNRTFLQIQCHSIDFILRVCLNLDQWLNTCVAIERAYTVIKATRFDKKQSKRAAKFVIIIVLIIIIGTSIHDPIYRSLIDEESDIDDLKRIWCFIKYPPGLEIYSYIMHSFHFFGPFLINLIASIILITKKSRQQATIHTHQTYKEILREQFRQHKHLLVAPIVLVILALPRLIITFISKCMKSTNEAWLFLIGYFISFIPSMLTFVIFILPSKFYKKEFQKSFKQYRSTIQRRLHLAS